MRRTHSVGPLRGPPTWDRARDRWTDVEVRRDEVTVRPSKEQKKTPTLSTLRCLTFVFEFVGKYLE